MPAVAGKSALQAHDVADDLGDRMVVLHRDFLVDFDGRVSARASGTFSTIGMSCSPATSRILNAMWSTPLATQIGADMPRS